MATGMTGMATATAGKSRRRLCAGFSLMELLLVLGMMALVAAAVSLGIRRSMTVGQARPPQEVFYIAASEARIRAMNEGRSVQLSFDAELQRFVITFIGADGDSANAAQQQGDVPWAKRLARQQPAEQGRSAFPAWQEQAEFPLAEGSQIEVTFYGMLGTERLRLPEPLAGIVFHPSGASTAAEVIIEDKGTGFREVLYPDSFSSGPRLGGQGDAALSAGGGRRNGW